MAAQRATTQVHWSAVGHGKMRSATACKGDGHLLVE
jgi:hypothetical protein